MRANITSTSILTSAYTYVENNEVENIVSKTVYMNIASADASIAINYIVFFKW